MDPAKFHDDPEASRPFRSSFECEDPLSKPANDAPFWRRRGPLIAITILALLNLIQLFTAPNSKSRVSSAFSHLSPAANDTRDVHLAPPHKAVVLASFKKQNVDWTSRLPHDWRVYRYLLDDATPMLHGSPHQRATATTAESVRNYTLTTPGNRGREAMAYLTFIIDHYANLPLFTVFMHGHEHSWHQIEHADLKIRALNFTAAAKDGYSNIRCTEVPQCLPGHEMDLTKGPDAIKWPALKPLPAFWRLIFPDGPPPPSKLGAIGTAQFVVSRDAIRSRSLDFWKGLRRPLERDFEELEKLMPELKITGDHVDRKGREARTLGLLYEKLWHVFFGKPDYHCFGEAHCREVTFSNAITCDRYIGLAEKSMGWEDIKCHVDEAAMERAAETQAEAIKGAIAKEG